MCTGVELALLAAGTGAQFVAQNQRERATQRAINQGAEQESQIQQRANKATQDYVQETFDPTTRAQNYETEATTREQTLGDLLAKQPNQEVSAGTGGAVSDDYTRRRAQATADAADRARSTARLLARGGATGSLFGKEAIGAGDYTSGLLGFNVDSRMNRNLTDARVRGAQNKGQGLATLGSLLQGAALAGGGAGYVLPVG